jgi:type VI secretion system secreted protein VgrG
VIVDFFEGDPDQPIIVGTVYNADQMPPYLGQGPDSKHKNDNRISGFKSNTTKGGQGFNELRFDDTNGREQVFIHAEKNLDTRVKSSSHESVGSSRHVTVGGEKDGKKWGGVSRAHLQGQAPGRRQPAPGASRRRQRTDRRRGW